MLLVFILFAIILFALFILMISVIKVRIEDLTLDNFKGKFIYDYSIYLELYILNKIKILSINLNKNKVQRLDIKNKFKKVDLSKYKRYMNKDLFKKMLSYIKISKINLKIKVGTQDVLFTAGIIAFLSSIIAISLSNLITKFDNNKHKYIVTPIYVDKNVIKILLDCIIEVKMVHIINIIYNLIKKRSVRKYERTSDRRSYEYGYE